MTSDWGELLFSALASLVRYLPHHALFYSPKLKVVQEDVTKKFGSAKARECTRNNLYYSFFLHI